MPLVHGLGQSVANAGTDPDQGGLLDPHLGCDLIGGAETDPSDVPGQTVGVLADHPHGIVAIGLVDPHGETEIRAGDDSKSQPRAIERGIPARLAAGDRVTLDPPVGHADRHLLP